MAGLNFTENQQRALDLESGKLVLAGAGSGKTTVLTERYIRLLERPEVEPRHIVAMTFTRKAAANLAAKVHKALLERAANDPERADLWRQKREAMPWARISTIHRFCGSLLRAYPLEAGVDPDFVVGGESRADLVERVHQRVRDLAYHRDPDLDALLVALGRARDVERLVTVLVDNPEIAEAAARAEQDPGAAVRQLDTLLEGMLNLFQVPDIDRKRTDHTAFVTLIAALRRVAAPLLADPQAMAQTLSYDDLERYAYRLVSADTPVARHIRASIRYLLVDEFQDTSTLQWRLIRSLVLDDSGRLDPGRLFLVGDEKQSIYGFRDADVTVVRKAREELGEIAGPPERWFVNLNDNFRTQSNLIAPLNEAFERLLAPGPRGRLPFEADPQPLEAKRSVRGTVNAACEFAVAVHKEMKPVFGWLARRLKQEVEQDRVMIPDPESGEPRRLEYEDVGILLRARTHMQDLEDALRAADVPYTLVKGGGFMDRQETLDLVHLLAALADPRDRLALAGTLRSPMFNVSDAATAVLFTHGTDPYTTWEKIAAGNEEMAAASALLTDEDRAALRFGWSLWHRLTELAGHSTPADLLLTALEAGGAWAAYATGRRGEQRVANLYQFVSLVRGLGAEGYFTLRRLNERLQRLREEPDEEMDAEADVHGGRGVKVMSIHASKGLEFPYVVLADLASASKGRGMRELGRGHLLLPETPFTSLANPRLGLLAEAVEAADGSVDLVHRWMYSTFAPAEEHAELLRLMYVSATRARDRLLIVSNLKTNRKGEPEVKEGSQLGLWMNAFGVELEAEGTLVPPEHSPVRFTQIDPPDLVDVTPPLPHLDGLDALELPAGTVKEASVHLAPVSPPGRWMLPITAFATYLADGSLDAFRRLVWYASAELDERVFSDDTNPLEPEALEGGEGLESFGSWIGDVVHRAYQTFGPGCAWETAETFVETELSSLAVPETDRARIRDRVEALLRTGGGLGLADTPEEARRELPILLGLGPAKLRGRIDLAWREGDHAVVVDYKTNTVADGEVETLAREHGYDHQAKLYALALARAWGLESAECRLVFLDPGKELRFALDPGDEAAYSHRVEELNDRWRTVETAYRLSGNGGLG